MIDLWSSATKSCQHVRWWAGESSFVINAEKNLARSFIKNNSKSNFRQDGQKKEKQRWEQSEKRRAEERRSKKRKCQKKGDPGARKGRKVATHYFFNPMICGSGGSTSRLANAAGAETSGAMRDDKLHTAMARSTSRNDKAQNTPWSDHRWKLRCRNSARRCGSKHVSITRSRCRKSSHRYGGKQMSRSKCTKHTRPGARIEIELWKSGKLDR